MDCTICANETSPATGRLTSGRSSNRSGSSRSQRFQAHIIGGRKESGARERRGRRLVGLGTRVRCRARAAHVKQTSMCAKSRFRCATWATAHVVVRIVVAPRPPGRLRRAGNGGRGRSDPPFSMPVVASGRVGMCTPSHPPRGSLRVHQSLREGHWTPGTGRVPRPRSVCCSQRHRGRRFVLAGAENVMPGSPCKQLVALTAPAPKPALTPLPHHPSYAQADSRHRSRKRSVRRASR